MTSELSPPAIPKITPIVIPAVPPTSTPFFHPNTNTINTHKMLLIEKP